VDAGAAALCLHPRSASQLYRGLADHAVTERLAASVPVPVIASGDVTDRAACLDLLALGASGVMVARGAIGRPWIFDEILEDRDQPGMLERRVELCRFVDDVIVESGPRAVGHLRQFWPRFRRGGTLTKLEATELMQMKSPADIKTHVANITRSG
jgi:tRNA-dihydrouridine synthase B